jgi:tRNA threonylcarbamoyladenosine dehydratase
MSEISISPSLEDQLASKNRSPDEWSEPTQFDLSNHADQREVSRRLDAGSIEHVVDRRNEFADDLFEMRHPDQKEDDKARNEFSQDIVSQGKNFGQWFLFDWSHSLVRYPEQEEFQELRTFRNKDLVTADEQKRLLGAHAAVFGLSVGSNVVDQLVQGGIGGHITMGDFDILSPTNLNRIRATVPQVGMKKLDIAAIKVSELDPYVEQSHYATGVNTKALERLEAELPDILFDEIDDIAMKAVLRIFAAKNRVPLIMATDIGDTSIIDVERYDLDENTKPFHGKVKAQDIERLAAGEMPEADRRKLMIKIVGAKHISPRMLQSAMQIDKRLGGLPQLGATAAEGGSLASVAARELLLGRKLDTGRYVVPMRKALGLQHITSFREGAATVMQFVRDSKNQ